MKYTVKDLKKALEQANDDDIVNIERIHDVYFEKYNWSSTEYFWNKDNKSDSTEFTEASGIARIKGQFIIVAHI